MKYRFTIEHSLQEDGVHIANIESLICLKSKAFLDLSQRKAKGESVDSKHIAKHKKDVFRLAAMLTPASRYELPDILKQMLVTFVMLSCRICQMPISSSLQVLAMLQACRL